MDRSILPHVLSSQNAWDSALTACRGTQAEVLSALALGDHDAAGDAEERHSRAIDILVVTPAPDRAAMLTKIEFMASAYACFAIEAMMLGALVADARRLLVEA